MLYDSLRQPEEPEIKMLDWDAYIMKKLEKISSNYYNLIVLRL